MISSSGTSYRKKWNSRSAVAELAFRLSVICIESCDYRADLQIKRKRQPN